MLIQGPSEHHLGLEVEVAGLPVETAGDLLMRPLGFRGAVVAGWGLAVVSQAAEQLNELVDLVVGQDRERVTVDGVDGGSTDCLMGPPGVSEVVLNAPAPPGAALDQALVDQAAQDLAQRLGGDEGGRGQASAGGARVLANRAEHRPLDESCACLPEGVLDRAHVDSVHLAEQQPVR